MVKKRNKNQINTDLNKDPISFFQVERYLNREMSPAEETDFLRFVEKNPIIKDHLKSFSTQKCPVDYKTFQNAAKNKLVSKRIRVSGLFGIWTLFNNHPVAGAVSALALILTLTIGIHQMSRQNPHVQLAVTSKGHEKISLLLNEKKLSASKEYLANPGDTLLLSYKSGNPLYFQLWYCDDDGRLMPYFINNRNSIQLPPATKETQFKSLILLDDNWRKEHIYLLYARLDFSVGKARRIIKKNKTSKNIKLVRYIITRSE